MVSLIDTWDYFGSTFVEEEGDTITLGGIDIGNLINDLSVIWKNARIAKHLFTEVRKYRVTFDKFFAPDVLYMLTQIAEYRNRKSRKFRIEQAIDEMRQNTWLKRLDEKYPSILDFSQLKKLKFVANPTQLETLEAYNDKVPQLGLKGFLLGTPPGSGKTFMSIAIGKCAHVDVSIYIVPKNTVESVWVDGIHEQLGPKAKVWDSVTGDHKDLGRIHYDHYVFHYEALPLAIYLASRIKPKISMVAIDEAHNFNEIDAVRTQRLINLCKMLKCQNVVWATGTPFKAIGAEAMPVLSCIDPLFTDVIKAKFKAIFGISAQRANDILRNRMGLISYRIDEARYSTAPKPIEIPVRLRLPNSKRFELPTISEEMRKFARERYAFYLKNMTKYLQTYETALRHYEKTITTSTQKAELVQYRQYANMIISQSLPPDKDKRKEIEQYCKQFEKTKIRPSFKTSQMRRDFDDALTVVKTAQVRAQAEALVILQSRREECAIELMKAAKIEKYIRDADKKTIIFSSFVKALIATKKYLDDQKFNTLEVHSHFTKDIANIVHRFKTEPSTNPLIATLQSLAASQTLIVANIAIFLNAPFRDYIFDQAIHRIFRIGQNIQTYIYVLLLDTGSVPNVSTRAEEILKWSRQQVKEILGSLDKEDKDGIVKRLKLNEPDVFDIVITFFEDLFK